MLGGIILLSAFVLGVLVVWTWWNSTVNKHEHFDLYFSESVHGLSAGSDVRMSGRKIGQVETISLRSVPDKNGVPEIYAKATLVVDMEAFWRAGDMHGRAGDLQTQIDKGLRAGTFLPSLLAPGIVVELFFVPQSQARFSNDPDRKNVEIPTIETAKVSRVDAINKKIKVLGIETWDEKIREWERAWKNIDLALAQIDLKKLNDVVIEKIQKLDVALDAEDFLATLAELNRRLAVLNRAIEENALAQIDEKLRDAVEQMSVFSRKLEAVNAALAEISDVLDESVFGALRENIEKSRKILRFLREVQR